MVDDPVGVEASDDPTRTSSDVVDIAAAADGELSDFDDRARWTRWSNLWQVPTIVASLVLIGLGLHVAGQRTPENDFDGALDTVDALLADGELDVARNHMSLTIEPHLEEANELQRARFDATVADWVAFTQSARGAESPGNNQSIAEGYSRARSRGLALSPARLERWALASLATGDLDTARNRLQELEALSLADDADSTLRGRRNHVLRRLVETSLGRRRRQGRRRTDGHPLPRPGARHGLRRRWRRRRRGPHPAAARSLVLRRLRQAAAVGRSSCRRRLDGHRLHRARAVDSVTWTDRARGRPWSAGATRAARH